MSDGEHENGNGNGVTWRWLVGVMVVAGMAFVGAAWSSTNAQLLKMQDTVANQGQRIAVIEAQAERVSRDLDEIKFDLKIVLRKVQGAD
jgi:hypothetical protein